MPGPRRRTVLGAAVLVGAFAGPARADPPIDRCTQVFYPTTGALAVTTCLWGPPSDCQQPVAGTVQYCGPLP